jgi:hypothetical protein
VLSSALRRNANTRASREEQVARIGRTLT